MTADRRPPFHLAIPVSDLAASRQFYGELLGCPEGRSSERWIDFDLFGHQVVAHLVEDQVADCASAEKVDSSADASHIAGHNPVDGEQVPVPHFGLVLDWQHWLELAEHLTQAGTKFVIEPYIRFQGQVGEQATMFLLDPCGNALEFKSFRDPSQLFAK
jgi:extradiol dioxygenase family protein